MTKTLMLAASLTYTDWSANSHKFHDSLLAGRHIVVRYGRVGAAGQEKVQTFSTVETAAAKYWGLLRGKVGKGYHVDEAGCFEPANPGLLCDATLSDARASNLLAEWAESHRRRRRGIDVPDLAERSARTPRQGAGVLLALSDPACDPEVLLEAAMAGPSERFLYPMVLSHPNCPDEARVARALAEMGLVEA